ncbi:MAG TPA: NADH-quinone oxidoreductase subunit NuoE [bacterium]|jgi:NADH-quinone oxidoreductase subunit E|nr:NADH-quinone oxidoreductase subunit NuoE [bacterium]
MALAAEAQERIRALVDRYEHRQSALLPALFVAQEAVGFLPPETLAEVASLLELPPSEVISVASFYRLFFLEPVGRHLILLCTNLACHLNGAEAIGRRLEERLGIGPGQTTPDGAFTLRESECLAACALAPMMMVDRERFGPLTAAGVDEILDRHRGR